ncbi:GEVED domain-containing protein, partial [Flavobacterium macrobrachii]
MMNNYNCLNSSQTTWLKKWSSGNVGSPHETTTSRFKSFWLSTMALLLLMISQSGWSQVSGYAFSQSTGTYTQITGGTVLATQTATTGTAAGALDDVNYLVALPFDFTFNGVTYASGTNIHVNTNGFVSFGSAPTVGTYGVIGSTNVVAGAIAPFSIDCNGGYAATASMTLGSPILTITTGSTTPFVVGSLVTGTGIPAGATVVSITGTTVTLSANVTSAGTGRTVNVGSGEIRFETLNSAPNRKLVIQFRYMRPYNVTLGTINYQVILNETTNSVDISYGNAFGSTTSSAPQVGLRGSVNTDFNNRTSTTSWSSTSAGSTNSSTITFRSTVLPASGLTFSFTPPSCVLPGSTTVSGVTTSGATVSWLAPSPVPSGGYDYELRTSGAAGSGATGLVTSGNTTSLSQAFSSLTPATSYSFYVRSNCGVGGVTSWRAATNFNTLCNSITSFPYTETFESPLPCWQTNVVSGSATWARITGSSGDITGPFAGTSFLEKDFNSSVALATSPPLDLTTLPTGARINVRLHRHASAEANDKYEVYVNTTNSLTGATKILDLFSRTSIAPTVPSTGWYQYLLNIPSSFNTSNTVYVIFRGATSAGFSSYDLGIDDFIVEALPNCLEASALTTSNLTSSSVTISWTAPSPAPSNGYDYEIRTSGAAGSGATGLITSGSVATGVTTANITGLTANTTYSAYVRSNCGASQSPWTLATNFYTGYCVVSTTGQASWISVFNTTGGSNNITHSAASGATGGYLDLSATNTVSNFIGGSTNLSMTAGGPTCGFAVWVDWNNNLTFETTERMFVTTGYVTSTTGSFAIPSGTANGNYRMRVVTDFNNTAPSNPCAVVTRGEYKDFTFQVVSPPTCTVPTSVVASSITDVTATVNWASITVPSAGYDYYLATTATAPDGATIPTGNVTSATVNLTSLTSNTLYYFWVRSNCSTEQTAWAGTNFRTNCVTVGVPYSQNFESVTVPALPDCTSIQNAGSGNNWATSTVNANGFNSKVLQYAYNSLSAANAWFYTQGINLVAGTNYNISYKYGNNSTTFVEKLKVAYGSSPAAMGMTTVLADYPSINTGTANSASINFTPATSGIYYFGFNAYSDADEFNLYVDDILVDVGCSSANAGTAITSISSVCPGNAATLSSTGYSTGGGLIYQWERSVDSAFTAPTNLGSASNTYSSISTGSLTATTYFRLKVTCAAGSPEYSNVVTVNTLTPATLSALADNSSFCIGGTAIITASGAATYSWTSTPAGFTSTDAVVTVSPTASTTYNVVGVDANGCTTNTVNVPVTVLITPSPVTVTSSASTICDGSIVTLTSAGGAAPSNYTIGAGATTEFNTSPYRGGANAQKIQYLYTKAELNAAGISAGNINGLSFFVTSNGPSNLPNLQIAVAHTTATSLGTTFDSNVGTVVFGPVAYSTVAGNNSHTFTTPFNWNGNDNIVITVCSDSPTASSTSTVRADIVAGVSTGTTTFVAGSICSNTAATTSTNRPTITFNYAVSTSTTWTSSPSSTLYTDAAATVEYVSGSSATVVYAKPSAATTYSAAATLGTCSSTPGSATVNVNALPDFSISPATICQGDTANLTVVTSESNSYSWTPVGGGTTLTGASVNVNPTITTTYNVTATSNTSVPACQKTIQVVVTVNEIGVINSGTTSRTVSPDQPTTFVVNTTGSGLSYQWQANTGSGWIDLSDDYVDETTGNYSGTTTATLSVQNIELSFDGYQYRCLVTGQAPCTTLTPIEATLAVLNTGFSAQPQNVNLCSATSASFTIVTTGDEPGFVQWQVSTDNGVSFTDIVDGFDSVTGLTFAGANDSDPKTLNVSGITTTNNGYQFKCQLDFFLDSNIATLTVNQPVTFSPDVNTAAVNVCRTTNATTFTFTPQGSFGAIEWRYATSASGTYAPVTNGTPANVTYSGQGTTSLVVSTTASTSVGSYYYKAFVAGLGSGVDKCPDVETSVATLVVNQPAVTIAASANSYCTPGSAVTLTASGAASYSWTSSPAGFTSSDASISVTPSATTIYTVQGTDAFGCTNTAVQSIGVGESFSVTSSNASGIQCPGSNATLSSVVTPSSGTFYNITTGANTRRYAFTADTGTFTPLVGGTSSGISATADDTMSATITPGSGFTFNFGGTNYTNFRVGSNGQLVFGASGSNNGDNNLATTTSTSRPGLAPLWDDLVCTTGITYQLSGTAPNRVLTVEWLNMRWAYNFTLTSPVISFQVKLYETTNIIEYVYRQEAAPYNPGYNGASIGLMGTASTNFISLSNSSASPTVSTTTSTNNIEVKPATGQIYRFTPSVPPTYTYAWTSTPAGFTSTVASPVVAPTVTTSYNLTVTSSQGCSATAAPLAVNVQTEGPVISAQPESVARCIGQNASFTVASSTTSALTYQWRKDGENLVNGTGIAGATSATLTLTGVTALSAGTYDVVITTCTSLSTTSDQVTLTVNNLPTIVVTPSTSTYCSPGGTAVALTASGASTFAWSPSTGLSATTGNTVNASPSSSTSYVVTGTDANGCVNTTTALVNVTAKPQNVIASASATSICAGASTNLTATANPILGVANYSFNSSNGTYTPITGGTVVRDGSLTLDSFTSGALTIPSFTLNGVSYTTAYMTSNGLLTLGGSAPSTTSYTAISTTTGSGIALCPFNADLDRANTTVATDMRWQTVGDEIVFQWTQFQRYLQTENFDFQVRLNRVTGIVSFVYRLNSGPGSGTLYQPQVGIRTSATDFKNISVGTGSESWSSPLASTSNSSLVRFTSASPAQAFVSGLTYTFTPPAPITYSWSSSNVVNANSATTATTALASTETFSVTATNGTCTTTAQTTVNVVPNQTWYQDTDGDGYGKTDVTLTDCTQPSGYAALSGDCNDNNPAVNPGATEVCWNGIDDDCD